MAIFTFKRYEKKFLISDVQAERIIDRLTKEHTMVFDSYSKNGSSYGIYNIYFDDEQNSIINYSISRPKFKEKLRLRSYYLSHTGDETVFLEIKRKINGVVTKRRAILPYNAAMDYVCKGICPETDNADMKRILNEIGYFLSRYKLSPKVFISYDRIALFDSVDPQLRVTFDSNILTRRYDVDLAKGAGGEPLLHPNERLMEIKFNLAPPKWLCDVFAEEKIYMSRFSKYGSEYSRLRGREITHLRDREEIERKLHQC